MEKKSKARELSRGDVLAVSASAALYLNFLIDLLTCVFAIGLFLLKPIFGIVTGILLLMGLICFPIARRLGAGKLWRRVFAGGIAANALIVGLFVAAYAAMLLAW